MIAGSAPVEDPPVAGTEEGAGVGSGSTTGSGEAVGWIIVAGRPLVEATCGALCELETFSGA